MPATTTPKRTSPAKPDTEPNPPPAVRRAPRTQAEMKADVAAALYGSEREAERLLIAQARGDDIAPQELSAAMMATPWGGDKRTREGKITRAAKIVERQNEAGSSAEFAEAKRLFEAAQEKARKAQAEVDAAVARAQAIASEAQEDVETARAPFGRMESARGWLRQIAQQTEYIRAMREPIMKQVDDRLHAIELKQSRIHAIDQWLAIDDELNTPDPAPSSFDRAQDRVYEANIDGRRGLVPGSVVNSDPYNDGITDRQAAEHRIQVLAGALDVSDNRFNRVFAEGELGKLQRAPSPLEYWRQWMPKLRNERASLVKDIAEMQADPDLLNAHNAVENKVWGYYIPA